MDGGDGNTYYNPFNIGANGNGWDEIYANALARAKKEGWNTMQKALEGGIVFCKNANSSVSHSDRNYAAGGSHGHNRGIRAFKGRGILIVTEYNCA